MWWYLTDECPTSPFTTLIGTLIQLCSFEFALLNMNGKPPIDISWVFIHFWFEKPAWFPKDRRMIFVFSKFRSPWEEARDSCQPNLFSTLSDKIHGFSVGMHVTGGTLGLRVRRLSTSPGNGTGKQNIPHGIKPGQSKIRDLPVQPILYRYINFFMILVFFPLKFINGSLIMISLSMARIVFLKLTYSVSCIICMGWDRGWFWGLD